MDANNIRILEEDIRNAEQRIKKDMSLIANKTRVILVGVTGSGKSSLSCILAQKPLKIILGVGEEIELEGDGVKAGCKAVTKFPAFIVDQKLNIVYCDCPGFEDTDGVNSEILNAFSIDSLFQNYNGYNAKVKILLVISAAEIKSARGQIIEQTIERIIRMLPEVQKLKNSIGLVITKGDKRLHAQNYISHLANNPTPLLNDWVKFFQQNIDHVFVFPCPQFEDVGKQYTDFEDRDNLIKFIQSDLLTEFIHQITLSKFALENIEKIRSKHQIDVNEILKDLFSKIASLFQNEKEIEQINHWLDIMNELKNVKNISELEKIIYKCTDCSDYLSQFLSKLEEYEKFDSFVNKFIENYQYIRDFQKSINFYSNLNIRILEEKQEYLKFEHERNEEIQQLKQVLEKRFLILESDSDSDCLLI